MNKKLGDIGVAGCGRYGVRYGEETYITQEGRIGTAANNAGIGDKVCAMFGCAYLVVLRAKDDGYGVIGDVYVDGLGVVEAERELEEGKYDVEKSNIR